MRGATAGAALALVVVVVAAGAVVTPAARSLAQPAPAAAPSARGRLPCAAFARPDRDGRFVAREDLAPPRAPVDGDDWLALVNRAPGGALAAGYAPRDLVDVRTMRPATPASCVPPDRQCMRREAALALAALGTALRAATGDALYLDSAFRGYTIQCAVFGKWAYHDGHGFCPTTIASALPGHSQHQLGTAIDLFTQSWVRAGPRFRDGFGCTPAGRWLAEHGVEHGFVLPYPLHPDYRAAGSACLARPEARERLDPRTGYKYEPWHVRYIGRANAARFHAAWLASGPGTAEEITLEQWLRAQRGARDAVEPAVCEGCACDACATFRARGAATPDPCAAAGGAALVLDPASGAPVPPAGEPALLGASAEREAGGALVVRARVQVPANTLTQPPVVTPASAVRYEPGATFERLRGVPGGALVRAYPDLPGAWRLAIGRASGAGRADGVGARALVWRAGLTSPARDAVPNGFNARLPAARGALELAVPIEGVASGTTLVVALVREGRVTSTRELRAP